MAALDDEIRKITKAMGFNINILPSQQNLADFHANDFAEADQYVELSAGLIFFYGLPLDAKGARKLATTPGWELYDLRTDPFEMQNVYNDPAYGATVKKLKAQLLELKAQVGDTDKKYPELMKVRSECWD